jgi:hypothetical protein
MPNKELGSPIARAKLRDYVFACARIYSSPYCTADFDYENVEKYKAAFRAVRFREIDRFNITIRDEIDNNVY